MSMDDPGWEGGLTPPKPSVGRRFDQKLLVRVGAAVGVVAVIAVIVVVALLGGGNKKNGSPPATSTTASTGSTTLATTGTTVGGGSADTTTTTSTAVETIPVLGVKVTSQAKPVRGSNGSQISITDTNGRSVPISGVNVLSVREKATTASHTSSATPAAVIGLAPGDIIWAISQVTDKNYTPVTGGGVISTFLRNYSATASTSQIYVYFYEPSSGTNHTTPALASLLQVPGSLTSINCTVAVGC